MNALDRLREAVKSDAWHKTVSVKDLALVLAVVDAADNALDILDIDGEEQICELCEALNALTEDKP